MANEVVRAEELPPMAPSASGRFSAIVPRNVAELMQLGEMAVACGLGPKGLTKFQASGIIAFGMELGMSPMQALGCISFVNGKASVYGDGLTALLQQSGQVARVEERFDGKPYEPNFTAICTYWRRGQEESPFEGSFSVEEAQKAGLWGKNTWASYPKDMLMWKARGRMARSGFADVTKGLWAEEETRDFSNGGPPKVQSLLPPARQKAQEGRTQAQIAYEHMGFGPPKVQERPQEPPGAVLEAEMAAGAPEEPECRHEAPEGPREADEKVSAAELKLRITQMSMDMSGNHLPRAKEIWQGWSRTPSGAFIESLRDFKGSIAWLRTTYARGKKDHEAWRRVNEPPAPDVNA